MNSGSGICKQAIAYIKTTKEILPFCSPDITSSLVDIPDSRVLIGLSFQCYPRISRRLR